MQIQSDSTPQLRTIFLATHCPTNNTESYYTHSLIDTVHLFLINGIRIVPLFINDIPSSVVAKNEIINIVNNSDAESVVFVDHNIAWEPQSLLNIVNSQYDAIALPVVRKVSGNVIFDLDLGGSIATDNAGNIKVNYASTAMFKLSKKLVTALCDSNISITNPSGNEVKNVFENSTQYGKFFNESIVLCNKIRDLGYDVWIDPTTTCANIAGNIFAADFSATLKSQLAQPEAPQPAPAANDVRSLYE